MSYLYLLCRLTGLQLAASSHSRHYPKGNVLLQGVVTDEALFIYLRRNSGLFPLLYWRYSPRSLIALFIFLRRNSESFPQSLDALFIFSRRNSESFLLLYQQYNPQSLDALFIWRGRWVRRRCLVKSDFIHKPAGIYTRPRMHAQREITGYWILIGRGRMTVLPRECSQAPCPGKVLYTWALMHLSGWKAESQSEFSMVDSGALRNAVHVKLNLYNKYFIITWYWIHMILKALCSYTYGCLHDIECICCEVIHMEIWVTSHSSPPKKKKK